MPRILVVDDEPANREFVGALLRGQGYDVLEASEGATAIQLAKSTLPDLVIVDILMPKMNGYEFARRLRSDPRRPHVRIIFYTAAYHRQSARALAEAYGVSRVLAKPGSAESILKAVDEVLQEPGNGSQHVPPSFHEEHAHLLTQKVFEQLRQLEDANERLRTSELQYRTLFETNPFPMWIVDEESHRFLLANQAAVRHYGYSQEEFASLSVSDISLSEAAGERIDSDGDVSSGFQDIPRTRKHRTKAGVVIDVELFTQTINFAGREALLALAQDITERNRADQKIHNSEDQLHRLTQRLRRAQEEERTRVARYLHDELGQMLTALRLTCTSIVTRLARENPDLVGSMQSCIDLADEMVRAVQTLSSELRPGVLDLGIGAAIEWQLREFQARSGIPCHAELPKQEQPIDPSRATELYRIFQEALTNVARHASATRVDVALTQKPASLLLEVKDNGRGITSDEMESRKAIGLLGMKERASLMGGTISIEGVEGSGTTVRVTVPEIEEPAQL